MCVTVKVVINGFITLVVLKITAFFLLRTFVQSTFVILSKIVAKVRITHSSRISSNKHRPLINSTLLHRKSEINTSLLSFDKNKRCGNTVVVFKC